MAAPWDEFGAEGGLFRKLSAASANEWRDYTWHPFVQRLSAGTLPLKAFQHYLIQDYLFLIHFARAKALAVLKGESLAAMRDKAAAVLAILTVPETAETVSYTRWVLDRGYAGDILDLEVALVPCTVGYAQVALRILADPARQRDGNAYQSWIDTYGAASYQEMAHTAARRIDALGVSHGGEARFARLAADFAEAARLEQRFWQQGLDAVGRG
jgi:thiaminase/transcriptional activator TenA